MSEYIVELPNGGAADDYIRLRGYEKSLYGYELHEEIVRCRDCIYYKPDPDPIDPGWPMMCERTGDDMVEPEGFCHKGERRKP